MPDSRNDFDDELRRANIRTVLSLMLQSMRSLLIFASIVHSLNTLLLLMLNNG